MRETTPGEGVRRDTGPWSCTGHVHGPDGRVGRSGRGGHLNSYPTRVNVRVLGTPSRWDTWNREHVVESRPPLSVPPFPLLTGVHSGSPRRVGHIGNQPQSTTPGSGETKSWDPGWTWTGDGV